MPNNIVKSFAEKSGKSVAEVEKMWDSVKASLIKQGESEKDDSFYPKLTGILKKNLKIESIEKINNSLYSNFLKEKEGKVKLDIDTDFVKIINII